jgi:hypothetical protein
MAEQPIKTWLVKPYASPLKVELYNDKILMTSLSEDPSLKPYLDNIDYDNHS